MDPAAAILKLKPELAPRLRDAATWRAIRDDSRGRVAGLPLDIRRHILDPYFEDLRQGSADPATRKLLMSRWLARYGSQASIPVASLLADYPRLQIAPGDLLNVKVGRHHVAFHTKNRLTIYMYNSVTAKPLNLLTMTNCGNFVHYLGAGLYCLSRHGSVTSSSKFHDVFGPATVPVNNVLTAVPYLVPIRILPCGLLQASHSINHYLINLETGDYEHIIKSGPIGDDFGNAVQDYVNYDNLSPYLMTIELLPDVSFFANNAKK